MNDTNLFSSTFFLILIIGAVIVGLFILSRLLNKYRKQVIVMMKSGTYKAWVKENRLLWLFARLFDYAASLCFVGFVLLMIAKVSFDVLILFKLFFPFKIVSTILHLILYRTLPVDRSEIV